MQLWRELAQTPVGMRGGVVTIGNFDGVHRGHQAVLREARELAGQLAVEPVVVITFDPHPLTVLRPQEAPPPLTTIEERAELLIAAGADGVLALPFDRELAAWTPEEFVARVLVRALAARGVAVGANFRFGARAAGDTQTLATSGSHHGFAVREVVLQGGSTVWSSTDLRHCLATGDLVGAVAVLGRQVTVSGQVMRGEQRGRELGYPTANVAVPVASLTPGDGVYAGWLRAGDGRFPAAISVGTNPTFAGARARRVEAYVLDRDDLALYGQQVEVEFVIKLRDMIKFSSVSELVAAMADDVRRAREHLNRK